MTARRRHTAFGLVVCALVLSACMDQRVVIDIDPAGSYTVAYEHSWDINELGEETAAQAAPLDADEFWRRYTPIDHPEFDGACGYLAVFSEDGPLTLVPDGTFSRASERFSSEGSWRVSSCTSGPLPWPTERFEDTPGTSIEVRREDDVYTFELRIDRNAVQRLTRSEWYGALSDSQAEAFFSQSVTYIVRGPGELLFHPNGQQLDGRTVAWQVNPENGPFLLRASWVHESEVAAATESDTPSGSRGRLALIALVVLAAGGGGFWWWRNRWEYEDDEDELFDQPGYQQYRQFDENPDPYGATLAHQRQADPYQQYPQTPDTTGHGTWHGAAGAASGSEGTPAGWYQDPSDPSGWRWWDGRAWGERHPGQ